MSLDFRRHTQPALLSTVLWNNVVHVVRSLYRLYRLNSGHYFCPAFIFFTIASRRRSLMNLQAVTHSSALILTSNVPRPSARRAELTRLQKENFETFFDSRSVCRCFLLHRTICVRLWIPCFYELWHKS